MHPSWPLSPSVVDRVGAESVLGVDKTSSWYLITSVWAVVGSEEGNVSCLDPSMWAGIWHFNDQEVDHPFAGQLKAKCPGPLQ